MKKFYSFLIAAVALVGFAACESNEEATPEAETMTFVASFADETRTALADANGNVKWCANDVIAISNGKQTVDFKITSIKDDGTAVFTGDRMDGETFYAIYPAEGATFNKGSWTYTVPATQTAKNGTFADGAAVSTAVCTDGKTLFFENQCAVLRFSVPAFDETISSVEFLDNGSTVVKVTDAMKAGEVYYAAVKPADYKFTVRINGYLSKESTKTLSVAANTIYGLGELPAPVKGTWNIRGTFAGGNWETDSPLYKYDNNGNQVITNVDFGTGGEFKFYRSANPWSGYNVGDNYKDGFVWIQGNNKGNNIPATGKVDIYVNSTDWQFRVVPTGVNPF